MSDIRLLLIEEIGPDVSSERLREQIRVRAEILPRMATPEVVRRLRSEITDLESRLIARDA